MNLDSDYESDGDKSLHVEKSPEFAKILPLITPEKLITSTYSSKQKQKISDSKMKIEPMINTVVPFMKKKGPVRRLIIKQIVLENFKSYAGRQVIGPFHKRFTSVVGPNGSGKSNLIESLLFVFGKKASWMRLNKLFELIHSSANHQNIKKASVEVTFLEILDTDGEEFEIIPETEFTVRRVVYSTSVSKYEINEIERTQKEVVDLLKSKGIDLTNHRFLILQGEVEQISLMKPKTGKQDEPGLLEYLEDIVGSYVYKEQIDNLDEEYIKLLDVKREKGDLVKLSEKELEGLENTKNIAVEYVKREKLIYQMQNVQHQIYKSIAAKEIKKNEKLLEEFQRKKKEEHQKMTDKIKDKEIILRNYKKRKNEIDVLDDQITEFDNKVQECEKKDIKIRKELEHQIQLEIKTNDILKKLEKEYNKIIENTNETKKILPDKKSKFTKLQENKMQEEQKLNQMITHLNKTADKYRRAKNDLESKLQPFQVKYDSLQNEFQLLENEMTQDMSKFKNFNEELTEITNRSESLKTNVNQLETILKDIDEALGNMSEIKIKLIEDMKTNRGEEEQCLREISEIQVKLNESQNNANETKQKNHILTELLKAQQRRELSGIQGRLGDLAAIDEKYDVAITTSCGQLDSIVVNKFEDSLKCVEFLRNNKIGRATFISLDKMENMVQYMNKPFNAPNNRTKRLFDLIQVKNESYRTAFYNALRDTLVCDDLEIATQVAYGANRCRVVTLQGVLIDFSGAMSGGGKPRRGGMASKLANDGLGIEQISDLNDKKRKKNEELEFLRNKRGELEKQMADLNKDEFSASKEQKKYRTELEFANNNLKENEEKSKNLRQAISGSGKTENKKSQLEKRMKEIISEKKKIENDMKDLLEEKRTAEAKIAEIGGEELKNQQTITEELIKQFDIIEKEIVRMDLLINSTQKNLEKIENEKKKNEKSLEEISFKISNLKEKSSQIEDDTMKIMGGKKGAIEKLAMLREEHDKETHEKDQIESVITEYKNILMKLSEQMEESTKQLKKSKEDYNISNSELLKIRAEYQNITNNYDFIPFLEELENVHINSKNQEMNNELLDTTINQSLLDISIIMNPNNEDEGPSRKKLKITMDSQTLESIPVNQDLKEEELEQIEKIGDRIKVKVIGEIEKLKSIAPNINAINEFRKRYGEYKEKVDDLEKVEEKFKMIKNSVDNLKKTRFDEFMAGFNIINCKLRDAELELIDSFDPFTEGVVFSVRPPKKSWKQMTKLSGGEKTLSSLALVFALHYFKPTPLYFMDEIDAALDFKNVAIVAKYIKERTKDAQFIIISLRNNMFEIANKLIGVYKTLDTTKTVALIPALMLNSNIENVAY